MVCRSFTVAACVAGVLLSMASMASMASCNEANDATAPRPATNAAVDELADAAQVPHVDGSVATCDTPSAGDRATLVCHRWRCDRALMAASWNGHLATCNAGTLDPAARQRAKQRIDLYRFLASLPAVALEPEWEPAAQRCALLAHANGALAHEPPPSWACWSDLGARASAASLIANRDAPTAIDAFIEDPGNTATMVHRRWLLGPDLHRVALGSTDRYACIVVDGPSLDSRGPEAGAPNMPDASSPDAAPPRTWAAWPPEGPVPIDVFAVGRLDEVGWTIESTADDLDGARVDVLLDDAALPVAVQVLPRALGSLSALRFVPEGWRTQAGKRYVVRVSRGPQHPALAYIVEPIACAP